MKPVEKRIRDYHKAGKLTPERYRSLLMESGDRELPKRLHEDGIKPNWKRPLPTFARMK